MRQQLLPLLAGAALLLQTAPAAAVYRCDIEGRIVYRDLPCPAGVQTRITIETAPAAQDARQRAALEREQLERIEKDAASRAEAQRKARRRAAREQEALRRRCEKLEMRAKWAADDARTNTRHSAQAQRKAERAMEQYKSECADRAKRDSLIGVSAK